MNATLESLQAEAAVIDAEVAAALAPPSPEPSAPPAEAAPPALSPVDEALGVINLVMSLAVPFCPELDAIYTDDAKDRLARVTAPLLAKYGVSISSLFARWKEEIDFAFVTAPLMLRTVAVLKAARAQKISKEGDTEVAEGSRSVAPGASTAADSVSPAPLVAGS